MRGLRALAALLLAAALVLSGCNELEPPPPDLFWNGMGLEGARFKEHQRGNLAIYFAHPTSWATAERLRETAAALLSPESDWGVFAQSERIRLWIVPRGHMWPAGLPEPVASEVRAGAPYTVVVREEAIRAGQELIPGLAEAMALAITQPYRSPIWGTDWLYEGMGRVYSAGWERYPKGWALFPSRYYTGHNRLPRSVALAVERVRSGPGGKPEEYRQAAALLAALIIDRYGVRWRYPEVTDRPVDPAEALQWVTGARSEQEAVGLAQERVSYVVAESRRRQARVRSAAEISPVRVQPSHPPARRGANPNANASPHAYELDVTYDPDELTVSGVATLRWQNGEGLGIDALHFHLWPNAEIYARHRGAISIRAVTVDGREVPYREEGLDLVVPLGRMVLPGEQVAVAITFTTRLPGRITERGLGQRGRERFHLVHWFPALAVLDDRGWNLHPPPGGPGEPYSEVADFRVRLTVPAGTAVAATGRQVALQKEAGRWVYRFEAQGVRDWAAVGGTDLHTLVRKAGGVTIRVVHDDADWAALAAEAVVGALPLFADRFGPYPYEELVVTCCGDLEMPGLIFGAPLDGRGLWRASLYHQLAHQWFYAAVGNDQYAEPWLDEGFARYAEWLALRRLGPEELARPRPLQSLPSGVRVSSGAAAFGDDLMLYERAVYDRAAWLLEALEARLGTERFTGLMRVYTRQYRFRTATTADFVRLASEMAGEDLTGFFAERGVRVDDRRPHAPTMPLGVMRPRAER